MLVTPLVAVPTPDVFAAFDAIRTHGDGAVRMSSVHLAEELRNGLTAANLVARAGVLASANDLLPATSLVVPALVPFKRALSRLLKRPIGLSGSGPTLWALYDSEAEATVAADAVRTALRDGVLSAPGAASRSSSPPPSSVRASRGGNHDPSRRLERRGARRHRARTARASSPTASSSAPARPPSTRRPARWSKGGIEPETERVMANLTAVLDAAGATWGDVVKTTIFLIDMTDFATVNAIYGRFVGDPPPARSTVGVAALPKGARVEIEVIARLG